MKYYKLIKEGWGKHFKVGKIYPENYRAVSCNNSVGYYATGGIFRTDWQEVPEYQYYEQEGLPEKWYIKTTEESNDTICDWYDTFDHYTDRSLGNFYRNDNGELTGWMYYVPERVEGFTEISFETFKKLILNKKDMNKLPEEYIVKCDSDSFKECDEVFETLYGYKMSEYAHKPYTYICYTKEVLGAPKGSKGQGYYNLLTACPKNLQVFSYNDWKKLYKIEDMENKEIIGYKLKEDCKQYENAVLTMLGVVKFNPLYKECDLTVEWTISIMKEAGVLDLWFEPVYKPKVKELYFGKVKFTIKQGKDYAETEHGNIPKVDIKKAIDYIENPPQLGQYKFNIKIGCSEAKDMIDLANGTISNHSIAFGCQTGKLSELKEIYKAFD